MAHADTNRPKWITEGKLSDPTNYFVVCSHDGLDPEEVRQVAESKCLASAAKLGGATVTVKQKTVQSLTGSDSTETAEIQPITKFVQCTWTDRFLENVQNGVRLWLRCKVDRLAIHAQYTTQPEAGQTTNKDASVPTIYKRGFLNLISMPMADRLLIMNGSQVRTVIEVKSNTEQIELREGDTAIIARKQKYIDKRVELKSWSNGSTSTRTIYLDKDM